MGVMLNLVPHLLQEIYEELLITRLRTGGHNLALTIIDMIRTRREKRGKELLIRRAKTTKALRLQSFIFK